MFPGEGAPPRFFADRGGPDTPHGKKLFWPGQDGVPFRGDQAPLLKGYETDKLERTTQFHSRLFNLSDAADKQLFDDIYDRHCNGWYRVMKRLEQWSSNVNPPQLYVWLEWVQIYLEEPARVP